MSDKKDRIYLRSAHSFDEEELAEKVITEYRRQVQRSANRAIEHLLSTCTEDSADAEPLTEESLRKEIEEALEKTGVDLANPPHCCAGLSPYYVVVDDPVLADHDRGLSGFLRRLLRWVRHSF